MILTLHDERLTSLESLEQFLAGTAGLQPQVGAGTEAQRQAHVLSVLQRFRYHELTRAQKGLVIRYLLATRGYSRQHLSRLIARFREHAPLGQRKAPAHGFTRRYNAQDITALARLDALHENLSGAATRHLCQRAWLVYGDSRYERLATISVSHLVQPAPRGALPAGARPLGANPTQPSRLHRHQEGSRTRRPRRLHPHRQRASGRLRRHQGRVLHRRRGLRHPVAGRRLLRADLRSVPAARARTHARRLPVPYPWGPCR